MSLEEKYKKDDLERLIFDKNLSYREIGRIYGVSDAYIKKVCKKLDIKLQVRAKFPDGWKPHNSGNLEKNKKKCKNCNCEFTSIWNKQIFCNTKCYGEFQKKEKYHKYLDNQDKYCVIKQMRFLKDHILEEQNNCCQICNMNNEWNGKKIVFILDHIDGDAANNKRENLRLVCPNCDSQLDTYKSKNKNSARKERYLLNYKNL
jgi:hypothetical protein